MTMQTAQKAALDAKLVQTMVDATVDVLGTMAATEVRLVEVTPALSYKPTGDISSVIGISGNDGEGTIALSFTRELSAKLVSRLLAIEPESLADEDCVDGIGEIVNMISGKAKTVLSESAETPYKLSLPSIIQGAGHEIASRPKGAPFLAMVFDAEDETFVLQMTFKIRQ